MLFSDEVTKIKVTLTCWFYENLLLLIHMGIIDYFHMFSFVEVDSGVLLLIVMLFR